MATRNHVTEPGRSHLSGRAALQAQAARVAGRVGARRLVLIKPPNAVGGNLVDGHFSRALPAHVTPVIVAADQVDRLHSALHGDLEP